MKDLPNPFWALMFMLLGCLLLIAVLLKAATATTAALGILMAVATAGSNLISGAFGYINGHKDGVASVSTPGAIVSVGMDPPPPQQPAGPAQPK